MGKQNLVLHLEHPASQWRVLASVSFWINAMFFLWVVVVVLGGTGKQ